MGLGGCLGLHVGFLAVCLWIFNFFLIRVWVFGLGGSGIAILGCGIVDALEKMGV